TWFRVGDADLATHIRRGHLLAGGASLTDATRSMAEALGVASRILPATDDRVRTVLQTDAGELEFQDYFVRLRQEPEVLSVRFDGIDRARPTEEVRIALDSAELIVIAPSNPIVSVEPILALPGVRETIRSASARKTIRSASARKTHRVAVSPIVAGAALKGPADRMLASLGHESSALGVARMYAGLIDAFVIDEVDAELAP